MGQVLHFGKSATRRDSCAVWILFSRSLDASYLPAYTKSGWCSFVNQCTRMLPQKFSGRICFTVSVYIKQHSNYYTTTTTTILRLSELCRGLSGSASTRKVKPIWILL